MWKRSYQVGRWRKKKKKQVQFWQTTEKENSRTHLLVVLWTVPLLDSRRQRRCDEFPWSQRGKRSWTCSHISCCWEEITSSTHFDGERNTHTGSLPGCLEVTHFSYIPLMSLPHFSPAFSTLNLTAVFLKMTHFARLLVILSHFHLSCSPVLFVYQTTPAIIIASAFIKFITLYSHQTFFLSFKSHLPEQSHIAVCSVPPVSARCTNCNPF